tara:strand:+ start:397 stop:1272 length:876 start_codon:yes stop_codon:yes gene_type:complete
MLLIDASVYIFRAYHALPSSITGRDGRSLNAVHGYADCLTRLLDDSAARDAAVACFDESLTSSFRNELYADYKATRELPPEALVEQIAACRALTCALGVATVSSPVYEADDLIGTLMQDAATDVTIVSSDKDLAQLLRADRNDVLWDFGRDTRYDRAAIYDKFGVTCEQIPDYLALVGDTVDNIPGVPGIGAKRAAALLARWPSLDALLADLDGLAASELRASQSLADKLADHADQARLSKRLATIVTGVALSDEQQTTQREAVDSPALAELCDALGAGNGLRKKLGVVPL